MREGIDQAAKEISSVNIRDGVKDIKFDTFVLLVI